MIVDKCCCCIPLRGGVFIIALLMLFGNIAEVGILFLRREQVMTWFGIYSSSVAIVFWISVIISALYGAASLFGVIGAAIANRAMVLIFAMVNWIFTILSLLISTALWIYIMVKRQDIEVACTDAINGATAGANSTGGGLYQPIYGSAANATSASAPETCAGAIKWMSIWLGVVVFCGNLFALYFASVVSAYASRLKRFFNNHTKLHDMDNDNMAYGSRQSLAGKYNTSF